MSVEIVAVLVAFGLAVVAGLIAWLSKGLINNLTRSAMDAMKKAHEIEVQLLEFKAKSANDLRIVEVAFLDYKIYVSNEHVRRGDHTAILSEIFRKIETIDDKLDTKMDRLEQRLNEKQDKENRRNTDPR
jgi:hypothetical protein